MTVTAGTCPLDCPDACGVLVESDDAGRFVRLRGNPAHGFSDGWLCGKTALYGDLIRSPDRLTTPLVRDAGGVLRPATWDQAIARIVDRVRPLPPGDVLALWYAGSMGRVARKFPLRMMHALGATLVDEGICDNTSTAGYECVLGRVVGPDLDDADDADLLLLWGCDMSRTVQHLIPAAQRLAKRGVPVVAIDIYRTDTIRAVERWGGRGLVVRPGSDAALALALARVAYERGFADREFLAAECQGAGEFEEHVRAGHDIAWAGAVTGLASDDIAWLAEQLGRARRPLIKTGVGWARRRNGGMSMRAVCSLGAVLGHADRVHYESFGCFGLPEDVIERQDLRPAGEPSRVISHVGVGRELESGRFGAVFVWGHNPAVTCPDTRRVRAGFSRSDVFVVVHEHFLTETAELADVVLPATMFVEHADIYRSYGHRYVQYARRACVPPPGPRSNVDTFAAIACALGLPRETWDVTADSLCEEFAEACRARLGDDGVAALVTGSPVKVTPPPWGRGRKWGTPSGRVELRSDAAAGAGLPAMATYVAEDAGSEPGAFQLIAAPSVDTHNSTFNHSPRHLARRGPAVVQVHPDDARTNGWVPGAPLMLHNRRGSVTLPVALCPDVPRGAVRVDGLPLASEIPEGVGINALVSPDPADMGGGNVLYSTRVDIRAG